MAKDNQSADNGSHLTADRPKRSSKKRSAASKPSPWNFPKNTLEEAITVAKAVEDKHGGNPMKADLLAKAVGFNRSDDWRFLDLLKSANMYGLATGSGAKATISLEKIGQDVVAPGSPQDRKKALLAAFQSVDDFKKVDAFYGTKRIPEDEYFLNTLTRQFNIPRNRADVFADVFRKNVVFLRSFNVQTGPAPTDDLTQIQEAEGTTPTTAIGKELSCAPIMVPPDDIDFQIRKDRKSDEEEAFYRRTDRFDFA